MRPIRLSITMFFLFILVTSSWADPQPPQGSALDEKPYVFKSRQERITAFETQWAKSAPIHRSILAWQICGETAGEIASFFVKELRTESDEDVRANLVQVLASCGVKSVAVPAIKAAANDSSPRIRYWAAQGLDKRGLNQDAARLHLSLIQEGNTIAWGSIESWLWLQSSSSTAKYAEELRRALTSRELNEDGKFFVTMALTQIDPKGFDEKAAALTEARLLKIGSKSDRLSEVAFGQILSFLNRNRKAIGKEDAASRLIERALKTGLSRATPSLVEKLRKSRSAQTGKYDGILEAN